VDAETDVFAWTSTLHLAELHRITVYDAGYLELSLWRGLPLATRDEALTHAANGAGVQLVPT